MFVEYHLTHFKSKIDIEIYADDILIDAFVSLEDKKFSLDCYLNNCSNLTIRANGDPFRALIYDSYLFENAPEFDLTLLSKVTLNNLLKRNKCHI